MPTYATGPGPVIESRVGTEGRASTAVDYGPAVQAATSALAAGFERYKQTQLGKDTAGYLTGLLNEVGADAPPQAATAEPTFQPATPVEELEQQVRAEGVEGFSPEERAGLQEALRVRKTVEAAAAQGQDPSHIAIFKAKALRDLIAQRPYLYREYISIVNSTSPLINDIQASLVRAASDEDKLEGRRREQVQDALVAAGMAAQIVGMDYSQRDLAYELTVGGSQRRLAAGRQALDAITQDNQLSDAARKQAVLRVAEPLAADLVAINTGAVNGIIQAVAAGTKPREMGVRELNELHGRYMAEARRALPADQADFERIVGWHIAWVGEQVKRLEGGEELAAIQTSTAIELGLAWRAALQRDIDLRDTSALVTGFGPALQAISPQLAAKLSLPIADAAVRWLDWRKRQVGEAGGVPRPLGSATNPATGARVDPKADGAAVAELVRQLSSNPQAVDGRTAEIVVVNNAEIARAQGPTGPMAASGEVVRAMAAPGYAQLVVKSGAGKDDTQASADLARRYAQSVSAIVDKSYQRVVAVRDENGLVRLTLPDGATASRQEQQRLALFSNELNAAIRAYAHATGSTDYTAAYNQMFSKAGK